MRALSEVLGSAGFAAPTTPKTPPPTPKKTTQTQNNLLITLHQKTPSPNSHYNTRTYLTTQQHLGLHSKQPKNQTTPPPTTKPLKPHPTKTQPPPVEPTPPTPNQNNPPHQPKPPQQEPTTTHKHHTVNPTPTPPNPPPTPKNCHTNPKHKTTSYTLPKFPPLQTTSTPVTSTTQHFFLPSILHNYPKTYHPPPSHHQISS